jgi:hypothetical protein
MMMMMMMMMMMRRRRTHEDDDDDDDDDDAPAGLTSEDEETLIHLAAFGVTLQKSRTTASRGFWGGGSSNKPRRAQAEEVRRIARWAFAKRVARFS